jgi:hypothetical protein
MRTSPILRRALLTAAAGAILAAPWTVQGESASQSGTGALSGDARLDFRVMMPRFFAFRVGTIGSTIDLITFDVPAGSLGDGTAVAASGGDAGGTGVNVSVVANTGQVTIAEHNNGGGNGLQHATLAEYVSYGEIATFSSDTSLERPILSDAGGNTSQPVLNHGNVTLRTAVWSFQYANSAVHSAGTYGGEAKGGRVTYTASSP